MASEPRVLNNTSAAATAQATSDLVAFGNGDLFRLLAKSSSATAGAMRSVKFMARPTLPGDICGGILQYTAQERGPDGNWAVAEALVDLPNAVLMANSDNVLQLCYSHRRDFIASAHSSTAQMADYRLILDEATDVITVGNPQLFRVLSHARSAAQGFHKTTSTMVHGDGEIVVVTTRQTSSSGAIALAVAAVYSRDAGSAPGAVIRTEA